MRCNAEYLKINLFSLKTNIVYTKKLPLPSESYSHAVEIFGLNDKQAKGKQQPAQKRTEIYYSEPKLSNHDNGKQIISNYTRMIYFDC